MPSSSSVDVPTRAPTDFHDLAASRPAGSAGWDTIGFDGKLEPGQIVFGRYLVKKQLGRGGMGTVWLVKHLTLDTDRALKMIVANIAFDPQMRGRFRREAQVMARFSHPNAVTVHDALLTNDVAFIEMEFVQGRSLDKIVERGTPMPLDWVARILEQLCDVLQVAHEHQIVHRDLKPSNLMLLDGRPEGKEHLKVLDFGIAKILGAQDIEAEVHTMTNAFMGTPPYASPEQADGQAVDARSDIYAVGVILYEFITGHRPFSGALARQISDTLNTPAPPFRSVNPRISVPPEVERVVLQCLAKKPADRPQTPRELAEAFLNAVPRAEAGSAVNPIGTAPVLTRTKVPPRTWVGAAAALLVLILGVAVWRGIFDRKAADPRSSQGGSGSGSSTGPISTSTSNGKSGTPGIETAPATHGVALPAGFKADGVSKDPKQLPAALMRESDGMKFMLIRGGAFNMGGIKQPDGPPAPPAHKEYVDDFYLAQNEVTNGEVKRFYAETGTSPSLAWEKAFQEILNESRTPEDVALRHPAVGLSHDDAERFAHWAGGRLPTEKEWEYAARSRGRQDRPYVWGESPKPGLDGDFGLIDSVGKPPPDTRKVMSFTNDQTMQSVFDLTGNVREWCADPSKGDRPKKGEPQRYVVRGGSWKSNADLFCTTAHEDVGENEHLNDLGFRIVLDWPPRGESSSNP
jgi:serine/threonine-protein kinase